MSTKISTFVFRIFNVFVLILMVSALGVTPAHAAGILYVTPGGTGDCSSWANACTLQAALTASASDDEIWVAAGTYKPTTGTDRSATFQLISGVAVYGGFAGTETARAQRDPQVNLTILSGDIDNNDSQTPVITDLSTVTGNPTNSYNVVTGVASIPAGNLDGFTITAGYADGASTPSDRGAGMFNVTGSPVLTNIIFSGNSAAYGGGGLYNEYSDSPTLTDVTFRGNSAVWGGGLFNFSGNTTLTNVTFSGNSATNSGGGIYNGQYGGPTLRNVTFSGNSAAGNGGGFDNAATNGNTAFFNVTFSGNSAGNLGGGLYNDIANPDFYNAIFWGNTAGTAGAQIYDTTFYGNHSNFDLLYSVVQDGCPVGVNCENLITADPLLGPLGNYGGLTQTVPLLLGSSAIGTAYANVCPATDQRGVARELYVICDIGAFEYDATLPSTVSITLADPNPNAAASVNFTVTFSEAMAGVDVADFSITKTGTISGESVASVSNSGAVYTVTVNTGIGAGTLRLDIPSTATLTDIALNPLSGLPYTSGPAYTVRVESFTDVPYTHWAWHWIERLYSAGITGGCGINPLTYCPESSVTRAQMAVFLERGMNGSAFVPPTGTGLVFTDVPSTYWAMNWIEKLYTDGITAGCGSGNYCPDNAVTRAQMAIFLLRAKHGASYAPPAAVGLFTDVPYDHWAANWIEQLYAEGVTGGCSASPLMYCPEASVTRAQMAVFLVRTFNLP